jgi:hypothetical protein
MKTLIMCAVLAAVVAFIVTNGPTGVDVIVEGHINQVCVIIQPESRKVRCVAQLNDGTTQVFDIFEPIAPGRTVSFLKRKLRYFGYTYVLR